MALQTYPLGYDAAFTNLQAVVPGQYTWQVLSVVVHANRDAGGTGTRTFQLTVSSGRQPLINTAAVDQSPDPGILTVCFAPVLTGSTVLVTDGALTITMPQFQVPAGYVLTVAILNPQPLDTWVDGVVWVDQYPVGV